MDWNKLNAVVFRLIIIFVKKSHGMNEIIFLIEEAPEGGYTAKALGESIFTEADSMEELKQMVKDAVRCHFDDKHMPKIVRLHYVKEETISMASWKFHEIAKSELIIQLFWS